RSKNPGLPGKKILIFQGRESRFSRPEIPGFPAPQEDPKSSGDVSEELSRQLEDILSTYCVDASQENPGEDGGHGEPPEEPDRGRSDSPRNGEQEPGGPEINGEKENSKGSEEAGDRDHRRAQEKKKAKGLGKEITLLMQTLNTLSTSEEKLAALCKKYAELVSLGLSVHVQSAPSVALPCAEGTWSSFQFQQGGSWGRRKGKGNALGLCVTAALP
uniref:Uncharacterized protein n=1 Tax=Zonotrichia albicollis TaxID=44394 RepID=A0A8D2MYB9_ZONAL